MTEFGLRIADSPGSLAPAPAAPEATVNLSRLFAALRRRRWAIALPVLAALGLGVGYLATTPRVWVASATLLLDAGGNAVVEQLAAMDDRALSESAIENARLVIRSDALAAMVVDRLALHRNPAFLAPESGLAARLLRDAAAALRAPLDRLRAAPAAAAGAPAADEPALRARAARSLAQQIGVVRLGRSGAVSIYLGAQDPQLSADIVNAYAEAYIADVLNANFESTERTTEWLQGRLADLESAAAAAAAQAEEFRSRNGLVSAGGRFMSEESVTELNSDLASAISDVARSRALVEAYAAAVARGVQGLRDGAGIGTDAGQALQDQQADLADAIANLDRVTANLGADHPTALILSAEVTTAAQRLFTGVQQQLARARAELSVAEARVAALRDSLRQALGDNAAAGGAQVELRALEQRAETLSLLYQSALTRFQEISQQRDFPIADVRILSAAQVPASPDSPRTSRTLAIALVLGLFAGVALAALREWGDRVLRRGEDAAEGAGVPFLGYLPDRAARPGLRGRLHRGSGGLADRVHAETLQSIRLAMDIAPSADRRQPVPVPARRSEPDVAPGTKGMLGVTGLRAEGTGDLAMDLARTCAAAGDRVLLVDANMRRPSLARLAAGSGGPSLVEVALGQAAWTDALRPSGHPGLDILPTLRPPGQGHVAELLSARPLRAMLDEARARYDTVVVDLAPLGPAVDARVLLRSLGQVLLVADWGRTPRAALRRAVEGDPILADRLIGVALARVDLAALRDYLDRGDGDPFAYAGEPA